MASPGPRRVGTQPGSVQPGSALTSSRRAGLPLSVAVRQEGTWSCECVELARLLQPDFHGKGPGFDENLKTSKPMADVKKHVSL